MFTFYGIINAEVQTSASNSMWELVPGWAGGTGGTYVAQGDVIVPVRAPLIMIY